MALRPFKSIYNSKFLNHLVTGERNAYIDIVLSDSVISPSSWIRRIPPKN